jgi:transcriptional regulator with XRE-family HTH domain
MWDRQISSRSMAGQLGIDESTMARKLRGNRKWTLDEVLRVAAVLDVPITDLLPEWAPRDSDPEPTVSGFRHLALVG